MTDKPVIVILGAGMGGRGVAQALAPEGVIGERRDKDLETLAAELKRWHVTPTGTEGYAKAEVIVGGVVTNELSSKTTEAKKVTGR